MGSWLAKRLVKDGHTVSLLCRNEKKLSPILRQGARTFAGDVVNADDVKNAVNSCEIVFHLAGLIGYKASEREAMEKVNVSGTKNIVRACLQSNVKRLIHMSSVVTVGASLTPVTLNEESPYNLEPYSFGYPETKRAAEQIVMESCKNEGLNAVILNPSTIYGAGDAAKGSRNTQLKVARGRFPFYTRGGVSIVDVRDVVEACISAISRGQSGERYILSGENVTIHQLFRLIAAEAHVKPPTFLLPNPIVRSLGKLGDFLEKRGKKGPVNSESAYMSTFYHWFDHSKATTTLGFKSRPALDSIRESVQWMKSEGLLKP